MNVGTAPYLTLDIFFNARSHVRMLVVFSASLMLAVKIFPVSSPDLKEFCVPPLCIGCFQPEHFVGAAKGLDRTWHIHLSYPNAHLFQVIKCIINRQICFEYLMNNKTELLENIPGSRCRQKHEQHWSKNSFPMFLKQLPSVGRVIIALTIGLQKMVLSFYTL